MKDQYVIIAPCFNEEKVIESFLREIEIKLSNLDRFFTIIIVDDGSSDNTITKLKNFEFSSQKFNLKVISLLINFGHQNAIQQGLLYAKKLNLDAAGYIIMDSDGEDDPTAIKEFIQKNEEFEVVFISRGKRQEGLKFKLGYFFYKLIFRIICGKEINFGNYSILSPKVLEYIAGQDFFHYAAFISKQYYTIKKFTFDRQRRIDGQSKMVYNSLVLHGLKSLIEYSENLVYFLIKIFLLICLLLIALLIFICHNIKFI